MKIKILSILFILILQTGISFAKDSRKDHLGVGVIIGSPTGLSAKYWIDETHAIDGALGFGKISLHADYLWHRWDIFSQPDLGRFGLFWGAGAKIKDKKNKDTEFGFRGVGGLTCNIKKQQLELFFELAPFLEVTPDVELHLDAGVGIRYYFF